MQPVIVEPTASGKGAVTLLFRAERPCCAVPNEYFSENRFSQHLSRAVDCIAWRHEKQNRSDTQSSQLNHALQRTAASRHCCNRRPRGRRSLNLGRSAEVAQV